MPGGGKAELGRTDKHATENIILSQLCWRAVKTKQSTG